MRLNKFDPSVAKFISENDLSKLQNSSFIKSLFNKLNFFGHETYSLLVLSQLLANCFRNNPVRKESYSCLQNFESYLHECLTNMNGQEMVSVKSELFIKDFNENQNKFNQEISKKIKGVDSLKNIFGFGLGEGFFEQELILKEGDIKNEISISGFDPYASKMNTQVRYLNNSREFDGICDLFLCRWSLHHVSPSKRWQILGGFLSKLRKGTRVLIIEEGVFIPFHEQSFSEKIYTLLLCLSDYFFNSIMRNEWGQSTDFYISHLVEEDFVEIENFFSLPFKKEVKQIQDFSFHQTLVTYDLG